jgi:CheY-like chemotaxis protein
LILGAETKALNLLIVDDNAKVRGLIAGLMEPFADKIHECSNGVEAIVAYTAERPDLVLMDIQMNGADGIEATRRIRNADPTAKIIIVTGFDDDAIRQKAMRAGACAYTLKDNLLDLLPVVETFAKERTKHS